MDAAATLDNASFVDGVVTTVIAALKLAPLVAQQVSCN
jgi:hypothetical protein